MRVGGYEIRREIGHGGMGRVYLARQVELDRLVALKELRFSDERLAQLFVREARMAAALSHPNIVIVHEYLVHEGRPYIAMEYIEGGSLRPWIGRLSMAQIAGVLEGLLAGLAHAEAAGIVHRDLKPENLMIDRHGRVKIADFGIAKASTLTSGGASTAGGIGTPAYMAPERALAREVGPWTDLYSVGILAWELLAGRVPFHDPAASAMTIMYRHVNEPVPPPPGADPRLAAWIARLVAKEPGDRPAGAAVAWDRLDEIFLTLLGARWRRDAPLTGAAPSPDGR